VEEGLDFMVASGERSSRAVVEVEEEEEE